MYLVMENKKIHLRDKFILLGIILLAFTTSNCKFKYNCEFKTDTCNYFAEAVAKDSLIFKNENNQQIIFHKASISQTKPYEISGSAPLMGKRRLDEDCVQQCSYSYSTSDNSFDQKLIQYAVYKKEKYHDISQDILLTYCLSDFKLNNTMNTVDEKLSKELDYADSLLINVSFGNHTYDSIYVFEKYIHLKPPQRRIYKTYIHPRKGFVAFCDSTNHTKYVLQ